MRIDDPRLTAYALNELTAVQRMQLEGELESDLLLYGEIDEICAMANALERSFTEQPVPVPTLHPLPAPPVDSVIGMPARSRSRMALGMTALLSSAACVAMAIYAMMNVTSPSRTPALVLEETIGDLSNLAPVPAPKWGDDSFVMNIVSGDTGETNSVAVHDEGVKSAESTDQFSPASSVEPAEMLLALRKHATEDDLPNESVLPPLVENEYMPAENSAETDVPVLSGRASYPWVRRYLADAENGKLPPREAVRVEELVNAFPYNEPRDIQAGRIATGMRLVACPWDSESWLLGILLKNTSTVDDVEVKARLFVRGSAVSEYRLLGFAQPKQSSAVEIPRILPAGESQFVIYQLRRKVNLENSRKELASLSIHSRIPGRSWDRARLACHVSDRSWLSESEDFRFAALMTAFGEALRGSGPIERTDYLAEVSQLADVIVGSTSEMTKPQWEAVRLIKRAEEIAVKETQRKK